MYSTALHQGAPGQVTSLEDPPPWLRPTYCFASVIVWTEKKSVTISDRFILTLKQSAALVVCVLISTTKQKCRQKSASGWPGLMIFWPGNDLAPLHPWRRQSATVNVIEKIFVEAYVAKSTAA